MLFSTVFAHKLTVKGIMMIILYSKQMVMMPAAVTYIDSSAVQALKDLYQEYKLRDIQVEWDFELSIDWILDSIITTMFQQVTNDFGFFFLQIIISNPSPEVLLTLSKSGLVELIGKEWYFVRVHDAVQVCLQHVQSMKPGSNNPQTPLALPEDKQSFLGRLLKQTGENLSITDLESGNRRPALSMDRDSPSEPLLSKEHWSLIFIV